MGTQVRGSPCTETMDDDDNFLLRYLLVDDTLRYELVDDDQEDEVLATVATMDAESSHGGAIRQRRLTPRDHGAGEATIIAYYFAANPVYTPKMFRRRYSSNLHGMSTDY